MVKFLPSISDDLRDWALRQPGFWVASAPLRGKHINLSPKGMASATFTIFDPNHCAYVDATGSGCETVSHIYENGRVTLCWCSYDPLCRILRFWCWGKVIEHDSPAFPKMLKRMGKEAIPGARAIIMLEVWKVSTSCGKAVPMLQPAAETPSPSDIAPSDTAPDAKTAAMQSNEQASKWADRDELNEFATKLGPERVQNYRRRNNANSLDGLAGLRTAKDQRLRKLGAYDIGPFLERVTGGLQPFVSGLFLGVLIMIVAQAVFSTSTNRARDGNSRWLSAEQLRGNLASATP